LRTSAIRALLALWCCRFWIENKYCFYKCIEFCCDCALVMECVAQFEGIIRLYCPMLRNPLTLLISVYAMFVHCVVICFDKYFCVEWNVQQEHVVCFRGLCVWLLIVYSEVTIDWCWGGILAQCWNNWVKNYYGSSLLNNW
jgi:hypothetical protein